MILIEDFLVANDRHVLRNRLRHQDPIERIFMLAGQKSRSLAVLNRDRKFLKTKISYFLAELDGKP